MLIPFLFATLAFAESPDVRSLSEKTFTRDNTFCMIGGDRRELQLRSHSQRSEMGEKKYGDHAFYYLQEKPTLLPLNVDKLNSYRFFPGVSKVCSKTIGYQLDEKSIAVLFLKENRPFMDKLSLQLFNARTAMPELAVDSGFTSDKTEPVPGGFLFRTYADRQGLEMGSVKIQDSDYFFQDRDFPIWKKYTRQGFEVVPSVSFEKFQWKTHFKDQTDFLTVAGWNEAEKKFTSTVLYLAVNHQLKKQCILLTLTKTKLTGQEQWRCR